MIFARAILLLHISRDVTSLPCLSNESKKDFDESRIAFKEMENHLGNTVKALEEGFKKKTASIQDQLGVVKDALTNVGEKIKKVDGDFQVLGKDFQNRVYVWFCSDTSKDEQDDINQTFQFRNVILRCLEDAINILKEIYETKWHKYNGHFYYYSSDSQNWFTAEKKCREIRGYIIKIDDRKENEKSLQAEQKILWSYLGPTPFLKRCGVHLSGLL